MNNKIYYIQNERKSYDSIICIDNELQTKLNSLNINNTFGECVNIILAISNIDITNPSLTDSEINLCLSLKQCLKMIRNRGIFEVGNTPYTTHWDLVAYFCIVSNLINPSYFKVESKSTQTSDNVVATNEVLKI